jgi:hypothetical protein
MDNHSSVLWKTKPTAQGLYKPFRQTPMLVLERLQTKNSSHVYRYRATSIDT